MTSTTMKGLKADFLKISHLPLQEYEIKLMLIEVKVYAKRNIDINIQTHSTCFIDLSRNNQEKNYALNIPYDRVGINT